MKKRTSIFNLELEFLVRKALALCMAFVPPNGGYTLLEAPKNGETDKSQTEK